MAELKGFRDLLVYKKSYHLAIWVFDISHSFPKHERYALTDQVIRSSRSVVANIAEAWAKRIYKKSFIHSLSISYGEELETEVWLDFAFHHKYIDKETHNKIREDYTEVRKLLIYMINNPHKFCKS